MTKKEDIGSKLSHTPRSAPVRSWLFFQFAEVLNASEPDHEFDEICEFAMDIEEVPTSSDRPEWVDRQFSPAELKLVSDTQAFLRSLPTPWTQGTSDSERMVVCLVEFGAAMVRMAADDKVRRRPPRP